MNTTNWIVTTIAGQAGSPAFLDGTNTAARFSGPDGSAVDASGNLFVADGSNNCIRKIAPQGANWFVTPIGGQANGNFGSQDGVGAAASFNHPIGVAVDTAGNVYVADSLNIRTSISTHTTTAWTGLEC